MGKRTVARQLVTLLLLVLLLGGTLWMFSSTRNVECDIHSKVWCIGFESLLVVYQALKVVESASWMQISSSSAPSAAIWNCSLVATTIAYLVIVLWLLYGVIPVFVWMGCLRGTMILSVTLWSLGICFMVIPGFIVIGYFICCGEWAETSPESEGIEIGSPVPEELLSQMLEVKWKDSQAWALAASAAAQERCSHHIHHAVEDSCNNSSCRPEAPSVAPLSHNCSYLAPAASVSAVVLPVSFDVPIVGVPHSKPSTAVCSTPICHIPPSPTGGCSTPTTSHLPQSRRLRLGNGFAFSWQSSPKLPPPPDDTCATSSATTDTFSEERGQSVSLLNPAATADGTAKLVVLPPTPPRQSFHQTSSNREPEEADDTDDDTRQQRERRQRHVSCSTIRGSNSSSSNSGSLLQVHIPPVLLSALFRGRWGDSNREGRGDHTTVTHVVSHVLPQLRPTTADSFELRRASSLPLSSSSYSQFAAARLTVHMLSAGLPVRGILSCPCCRVAARSVICAICFVDFEDTDVVMPLPCDARHVFHADCVKQWFRRSSLCPTCKEDVVCKFFSVAEEGQQPISVSGC